MKKMGSYLIFIILVFISAFSLFFIIEKLRGDNSILKDISEGGKSFVAGTTSEVQIYDIDLKEVQTITRGTEVNYEEFNEEYYSFVYNGENRLIKKYNIGEDPVLESELYVKYPCVATLDNEILFDLDKTEKIKVIGYNSISDGVVDKYEVVKDGITGYVYSKYLTNTIEDASSTNTVFYEMNAKRSNLYGGGSGKLSYPDFDKPTFTDNNMPEEVRAIYINMSKIEYADYYLELYNDKGINSVVVDIKEVSVAYPSEVTKKYSESTKFANELEVYKDAIKKLQDKGFYVIGRITVFKDYYYAIDNKDNAITKDGELFSHSASYWPSPYSRDVWEYNTKLALEAVELFDFNEIQFDYTRFTDGTNKLEENGTIDLKNEQEETKAEAIEGFLRYATDAIHETDTYVAVDVFGESAHPYVTSYGQYWPNITNIVDVISPMPYPDHFNAYQYNVSEIAWVDPYQLLTKWSSYALARQKEAPSPAIVRPWIQAYDSIRSPYVTYGPKMIAEQVSALYDSGIKNGFITWNAGSSLSKYKSQLEAFGGDY